MDFTNILSNQENRELRNFSDKLYRWADRLDKPCRAMTAKLSGILPPNEVKSLFKGIGSKNSFSGQTLLNDYKELIEAAKSAERELSDSNTVDKSTKYFQTMRNRAFELADSMRNIASEDSKQKNAEQAKKLAEKKQNTKAIIISLFIICAFVLSVWLLPFTPFTWLKNHPNSYGIQGSVICLITCLVVGFFKPQWRKWWWGGAIIAFLGVLLSLLGGPDSSNIN